MGISLLLTLKLRWQCAVGVDHERGDVPGWVLITLMTAGIVTALWVVAEPTLRNLLTNALNITGDPNK
jgi:hypothetical protein